MINLKVRINNFENLISNNLDNLSSQLPNSLSIQMLTDTILLNSAAAEYNHGSSKMSFGNVLIRDTVNMPIKGLVKIFFGY